MTDKKKEKKLVNYWILNQLANLQKDYFVNLEEKKINLVTANLIKFTREKLSNEYLELIKISPWDDDTKNTLLFVYQQLLIMLHPVAPFITENFYQDIAQERVLDQKIDLIAFKEEQKELWQIDCLLILISNIRNFSQKDKVKKFYLELNSEWDNKFDFSFDFNYFLEPLVKSEIFVLAKNAPKSEFGSFLDLAPFGFLWYHESVDRTELERQLDFYQKEWERSNKILSNDDFRKKAPFHLIKKEEEKLIYYENQKKKILSKL